MDYSKYASKLAYPQKPPKPMPPKNPGIGGTSKDYSEYTEKLRIYEKELETYENGVLKEYRKAVIEYNEDVSRLQKLFKHDCLEENGLLNHPKAEKVWSIAYREGHSGGYNDVNCVMSYLAELLLD